MLAEYEMFENLVVVKQAGKDILLKLSNVEE